MNLDGAMLIEKNRTGIWFFLGEDLLSSLKVIFFKPDSLYCSIFLLIQNLFDPVQYFLNAFKSFWIGLNRPIYVVKSHIWSRSKIFECIQNASNGLKIFLIKQMDWTLVIINDLAHVSCIWGNRIPCFYEIVSFRVILGYALLT